MLLQRNDLGAEMSKKQFMIEADRAGLEVDFEPDTPWLSVLAPQGKVFGSCGCHVDASFNNHTTPSGEAFDWKACLDELRHVVNLGFNECPDGEACETCHPEVEPMP